MGFYLLLVYSPHPNPCREHMLNLYHNSVSCFDSAMCRRNYKLRWSTRIEWDPSVVVMRIHTHPALLGVLHPLSVDWHLFSGLGGLGQPFRIRSLFIRVGSFHIGCCERVTGS